jgi:hypothetical protein
MISIRRLASSWRTTHANTMHRNTSADLTKTMRGGLEVLVDSNPSLAYRKLRDRVTESGLRQLSTRYYHYIKPKIKRKLEADRVKELNKRNEFNRRLGIAIELMEREKDQ